MAAVTSLRTLFVGTLFALFLSSTANAETSGWDLREYEHCKKVDTTGLPGKVVDVTYSPITNSLWLLTVGHTELIEYSMEGYRLRTMSVFDAGLYEPEGELKCCVRFRSVAHRRQFSSHDSNHIWIPSFVRLHVFDSRVILLLLGFLTTNVPPEMRIQLSPGCTTTLSP